MVLIKNFIINQSMRLTTLNEHLKVVFVVGDIRFTSVIIMLRRVKTINRGL